MLKAPAVSDNMLITSKLEDLSQKYPQEGIDDENDNEMEQQIFTGDPVYSLSSIKLSDDINICLLWRDFIVTNDYMTINVYKSDLSLVDNSI